MTGLMKNADFISPKELERFISLAQSGDDMALAKLCKCFKPLVAKEAKRESVFNALGEDALSIAWIIFIAFILRYNGRDFLNLPGLIRCHLHYELLHAVQKCGARWDNEASLEADAAAMQYEDETLKRLALRQALARVIASLSPKEKLVLQTLAEQDRPNAAAAGRVLHMPARSVRFHQQRIRAKVQRELAA